MHRSNMVETFISENVNAIVLSPLDDHALIQPVREAKKTWNSNCALLLIG